MSDPAKTFENPFRPGAGHTPPYLAGRQAETKEFKRLLGQSTILENLVLTGLRGVGKTVLLDSFKPIAIQESWLWVGTDLSETASLSEENIAKRLITDLSVVTSSIVVYQEQRKSIGFVNRDLRQNQYLNYEFLMYLYNTTNGLNSDKIKRVLEVVWDVLSKQRDPFNGIVFAYDEAQNLSDQAGRDEYPLSMLLDVFQSIQKKGLPLMLALTGLPTLFPKLVEARTYAERMFHVVFLDRLSIEASREAILKPINDADCPIKLSQKSVDTIVELSGGYPYFIQFICREVYDVFLQNLNDGKRPSVPVKEITQKLDTDFFAGRWARATDRQRELLDVIADLSNCDSEFTVQEIVESSKSKPSKPFSSSHTNQMLSTLADAGLIYKNRHGKYSFAVPLMGQFIKRQRNTNN